MSNFLQDFVFKFEFTLNRITFGFKLDWTDWAGLHLKYEEYNWRRGTQKVRNRRLPRLGNYRFKRRMKGGE